MTQNQAIKEYYKLLISTGSKCAKYHLWTLDESVLFILLVQNINKNAHFRFQKVRNFKDIYLTDPKMKRFVDTFIDKYSGR